MTDRRLARVKVPETREGILNLRYIRLVGLT